MFKNVPLNRIGKKAWKQNISKVTGLRRTTENLPLNWSAAKGIKSIMRQKHNTHKCTGVLDLGSFNLGLKLGEKQVGLPLGPIKTRKINSWHNLKETAISTIITDIITTLNNTFIDPCRQILFFKYSILFSMTNRHTCSWAQPPTAAPKQWVY